MNLMISKVLDIVKRLDSKDKKEFVILKEEAEVLVKFCRQSVTLWKVVSGQKK